MTAVAATGLEHDRPDLRAERKERRGHLLLIALPLLLLAVLFIYPVLGLLRYSLLDGDVFSLAQYRKIIDEPLYVQVLLLTFRTAFYTTVLCVLLGYPLAYGIVNLPPRLQALALTLVVVPFFISLIVRTYAWMVLLGRNGLVNSVLTSLPFFEPVQLMYSSTGTLIGMTYALLPFMVLTCYAVMRTIDHRYLQAAYSLGASGWQTFWRVFLPLTLPGLLGGVILVFIMALGFFITPRLMGGPSDLMIAMLIDHEIEMSLNWPFAAALSVLLLVVTLLGFFAYARLVKLEALFESRQ